MSQIPDAPVGLLDGILSRAITPRPDCLIFYGALERGYGRVDVGSKHLRVHRLVWELSTGVPIPDGQTIDHLCRVRSCINVAHMEVVTPEENSRRARRTPAGARPSTCVNGHEYTAENTLIDRNSGSRRCRECKRANKRKHSASRNALRRSRATPGT